MPVWPLGARLRVVHLVHDNPSSRHFSDHDSSLTARFARFEGPALQPLELEQILSAAVISLRFVNLRLLTCLRALTGLSGDVFLILKSITLQNQAKRQNVNLWWFGLRRTLQKNRRVACMCSWFVSLMYLLPGSPARWYKSKKHERSPTECDLTSLFTSSIDYTRSRLLVHSFLNDVE